MDAENGPETVKYMSLQDLRSACIQLLNAFISQAVLEQALYQCGVYDNSVDNLTLAEFKTVYRK